MPTDAYPLNAYSANPEQARAWLLAAKKAYEIAGVVGERIEPSKDQRNALRDLRRGVFAKRAIAKGERIRDEDVFFAIPGQPGQITANDWSKYTIFTATQDIAAQAPVVGATTSREEVRAKVFSIVSRSRSAEGEQGRRARRGRA